MLPNKPDFKELAKGLFEVHPETEVFYFASNGHPFKDQHAAYNHAVSLKDKTITEVYHPDISTAEISRRKAEKKKEQQQGVDDAFKQAFPELAACIETNKSAKRQ